MHHHNIDTCMHFVLLVVNVFHKLQKCYRIQQYNGIVQVLKCKDKFSHGFFPFKPVYSPIQICSGSHSSERVKGWLNRSCWCRSHKESQKRYLILQTTSYTSAEMLWIAIPIANLRYISNRTSRLPGRKAEPQNQPGMIPILRYIRWVLSGRKIARANRSQFKRTYKMYHSYYSYYVLQQTSIRYNIKPQEKEWNKIGYFLSLEKSSTMLIPTRGHP